MQWIWNSRTHRLSLTIKLLRKITYILQNWIIYLHGSLKQFLIIYIPCRDQWFHFLSMLTQVSIYTLELLRLCHFQQNIILH